MKLFQVAEQNKPYYSEDYVKGFNDGAKAQHEADKKEAERRGQWIYDIDDQGWSWDAPFKCDQCGNGNTQKRPTVLTAAHESRQSNELV